MHIPPLVVLLYVFLCAGTLAQVSFLVFVPLHSADLLDCHFCHVCMDIFGSQLQFVGELAPRQFITKAATISPCSCESVCIH